MTSVHLFIAVVLLLAIAAGMLRILMGPTIADRMLAAQLFGTCGIAILLVLSRALGDRILLDVALVLALLAVLATMTFVRRTWYPDTGETDGSRRTP